jgi:hypothetical protein
VRNADDAEGHHAEKAAHGEAKAEHAETKKG